MIRDNTIRHIAIFVSLGEMLTYCTMQGDEKLVFGNVHFATSWTNIAN